MFFFFIFYFFFLLIAHTFTNITLTVLLLPYLQILFAQKLTIHYELQLQYNVS